MSIATPPPRPAVLSLVLSLTAAGASAQLFPGEQHPTGGTPSAVTVADLNGDGLRDVVAVQPNTAAVLLATAGGLQPAQTYAVGSFPSAVAVGELNGDGNPDVVTANAGNLFAPSTTLTVLFGDGTGGFPVSATLAVGSSPRDVLVADVDGDGHDDIVTVLQPQNELRVLISNGSGGIAAVLSAPADASTLALGDLDGDGDLDLVAGDSTFFNSTFEVHLNDGLGNFGPPTSFGIAATPQDLALADLDGDGHLDVVSLETQGTLLIVSTVSVALGDGTGSFGPSVSLPTTANGAALAVADADGDGDPDVVTSEGFIGGTQPGGVTVLLNDGAGGLSGQAPVVLGPAAADVVLDDRDGDGNPDAVLALRGTPGSACVLFGDGAGGFVAPRRFASGQQGLELDAGDLDHDGALDVVTANQNSTSTGPGDVSVLLGDGAGGLGAPATFVVTEAPNRVRLGDLDGDSHLDAATIARAHGDVSVLFGDGAGALAPEENSFAGDDPQGLALADLDADGDLDAVVSSWGPASFIPGEVAVLLNDGLGGLSAPALFPTGVGSIEPTVADFDGDGLADVAVLDSFEQRVSVLLGDGLGGLGTALSYATDFDARDLAAGDLDGDGDTDLAVANTSSDEVDLLFNTGTGSFAPFVAVPCAPQPTSIAVGDLDGDGDADVATAAEFVDGMGVLRGDGAGGLALEAALTGGTAPRAVRIADLDGDGYGDLLAVEHEVTVLFNLSAAPTGVSAFGAGSPGCDGFLRMGASGVPTVGSPTFGFTCTGAPAGSVGLCVLGSAADFPGSDSLGLGITLHVDPFSPFLVFFPFVADLSGIASAPFPIPPLPGLVGLPFFAQGVWNEGASQCGSSPSPFVTTDGLQLVLQP